MAFWQANHGACSNPGTQLVTQNKEYACELNQSFNFVFCINLKKQPTFESSRRHDWLPHEMTSEKRSVQRK